MMFTGLIDKNGVKVYDGDIVKFTRGSGNWQYQRTMLFKLVPNADNTRSCEINA